MTKQEKSIYSKRWLAKNPGYWKQWQKENPDYVSPCRIENPGYISPCCIENPNYWKEYCKGYYNEYMRNRRKTNPIIRLNDSITGYIYKSLKGNKNGRHWEDLVGYTLSRLKIHLEGLFLPGMTFENYGQWHIDHIIPVSLWKFEKPGDREFKQCWARCNLQPLWAEDNLKKGNRI